MMKDNECSLRLDDNLNNSILKLIYDNIEEKEKPKEENAEKKELEEDANLP